MTQPEVQKPTPLVVHRDPAALVRPFRLSIALSATTAVFTAFVACFYAALMASLAGFQSGLLAGLPILISTVYLVFITVRSSHKLATQLATRAVITLDEAGLGATLPEGTITLPWWALETVSVRKRGRHRIIKFHLAKDITPETEGVTSTLTPATFDRVRKLGFHLGSLGIDATVEQVLAAAGSFTSGRLRVI
jgi:hypothetical protein